ncbi:MATH and LRR domain-containing protein PFE0570w-like isoform X2 [Leptidea sinapis]|uniref:MATH and LRR domain-containing protein PFE0570w-like isoform X2 n=1 Tax=Leptidea sinapis TaxID=189913 RepID=UPI0021C41003|nr:MATH and LRR domain-containing protein PFE0570w-like isoform X2 [Leptidea sinapis]
MEVAASQWRREWAGKAEYGKVTEGGVTRNIARAMEVLHASAPGAKVRVMRAAYHSSAGPGAPSSTFMLHSSRQVLSSGYNFSEPLSLPSKPLEVSSAPLESSPEVDNERIKYKVTEPDDLDISEPSKWRGSTGTTSIRLPSEESSSTTENMSIIDLDSRNSSRNTNSRHNQEQSDSSPSNADTRSHISSLLDAPVSLSTLKYTSLLYGSDEWNNRRKSYSFEDTSPLNKSNIRYNNSNLLDSSTDSGICKSTEIISDHNMNTDNTTKRRESKERLSDLPEESFQDWLNKNRKASLKTTRTSPLHEFRTPDNLTNESNVSVQSKGKMTITLPVMIESDDSNTKPILNDDNGDRRTKKVEFCKTELHFAAESGTVNIIATDEKPPPSYDFRKKRSAFVPLNNVTDKHITLFGDKHKVLEPRFVTEKNEHDVHDSDENTAATKSILKNKIPKPKPYLLGENMELGSISGFLDNYTVNSASSIASINRLLNPDNVANTSSINERKYNSSYIKNTSRTFDTGPEKKEEPPYTTFKYDLSQKGVRNTIKSDSLDETHGLGKSKSRNLRVSDLTYFGIESDDGEKVSKNINNGFERLHSLDNLQEEILHSVKLVQKISNSSCNSEADSEDMQEYQNISNFRPTPPKPKPRTKYIDTFKSETDARVLKPITEKVTDLPINHRRSRLKQNEKTGSLSNRSISEPPHKDISNTKSKIRTEISPRSKDTKSANRKLSPIVQDKQKYSSKSPTPTYENVYINIEPRKSNTIKMKENKRVEAQEMTKNTSDIEKVVRSQMKEKNSTVKERRIAVNDSIKDTAQHTPRKPKRTEKLVTPELTIKSERMLLTTKDQRKSSSSSSSPLNRKSNDGTLVRKDKKLTPLKGNDNNIKLPKSEKPKSITIPAAPIKESTYPSSLRNKSPTKIKGKTDSVIINKIKIEEPKSQRSRKSKYVINYDDKNGTVTSVCKIKSNQDSLERKYTPTPVKHSLTHNTKSTNKNFILRNQEQQWIFSKKKHTSNSKGKMHSLHKSCQLL